MGKISQRFGTKQASTFKTNDFHDETERHPKGVNDHM